MNMFKMLGYKYSAFIYYIGSVVTENMLSFKDKCFNFWTAIGKLGKYPYYSNIITFII